MSDESSRAERTFAVAEQVARLLESKGIPSAVIGGMALAVHGYARGTDDFDLGVIVVEPAIVFKEIASLLPADFEVKINLPDDSDPLGGVMTVKAKNADPVEIVNFVNIQRLSLKTPGPEAIARASEGLIEGSAMRVVGLAHLIALKLFAGGLRARADVLELLEHNPDADLQTIRLVCQKFSLEDDLDLVLKESR